MDNFTRQLPNCWEKEKEYKKTFDIHTSYKALKKAVERADDDL